MILAFEKTRVPKIVFQDIKVAQPNGDYYPFGKVSRGSSTVNSQTKNSQDNQYDCEGDLNYVSA